MAWARNSVEVTSRPTAATPMSNPCCSCKLTRVWPQLRWAVTFKVSPPEPSSSLLDSERSKKMLYRELSKHSHPAAAGGGGRGGSPVGAATVPEAAAALPEMRVQGSAAEPAPEEQAGACGVAQP